MEKLEPLLRYKFWISFGAAILLPAVGWYLATGSMSAEVDKRWKVVDGNFNKDFIKDSTRDSAIAKIPNNKYIEGIKVINAAHTKDLQQARANLCDTQKQYMVWPAIVSEAMASTGYRQAPPDPDATFKYGNVYRQELERVRKIIKPFDEKDKKGLVYAPEGILPKAQDDNWTMIGPPVDRMWDAQEDIWLLTSIMQAIAAVNKDATLIIDAPVKAIQEVTLRGGSQAAPKPARNPAGEGTPSGPPPARTPANPVSSAGDVSFNPAEEFGPEVVIAPAAPVGGEEEDDDGPGRSRKKRQTRRVKEDDSSSAPAPTSSVKRYIEGDNNTPYKTRGFYIRVAMDHAFVPELVSQLSNMPWPTEVVRVHQSDQVTRNVVAGRVEAGVAAAASSPAGFGTQTARGPADFSGPRMMFRSDEEREEEKQKQEEQKKLLVSPTKGSGLAGMAVEKDLVNAALEDPYVGLVVIAGTMTIYNQLTEAPKKPQPTQQQNKQPNPASPQAKQGNPNPPQKQGNAIPPTAQPKQGGNPAGPQAKQPASESKAGPNAQTAGKKPQPDAPAKPPTPGDKK